jgi:hypothetical protein
MHNLSHELFETQYRPPSIDVMRQAVLENEQLKTLYSIMDEGLSDDDTQLFIYDALDDMIDPRVDIMPAREDLAAMELDELRHTVASLIRIRRYANKRLIHPVIRPRAALRHKVA